MPILNISKLNSKEILPGFSARMALMKNMHFTHWTVAKGATLPSHHHEQEQISILIKGRFEFMLSGDRQIIEPGMVVMIPSDAVHAGLALEDCVIIDIFSPLREDYVKIMSDVKD